MFIYYLLNFMEYWSYEALENIATCINTTCVLIGYIRLIFLKRGAFFVQLVPDILTALPSGQKFFFTPLRIVRLSKPGFHGPVL